MIQSWLKPNRRALLWGMVPPAAMVVVGFVLVVRWLPLDHMALSALGWLLLASGMLLLAALAWQMRLPRVGYEDGDVLFYLRSGEPIRVPVEVVEAFLLGQGPTLLPGRSEKREATVTVVVRLAEKATEWARRDVKPSLGNWCDGYITIRGTWCEPLDVEVVKRLNRQLAAAHQRKESS